MWEKLVYGLLIIEGLMLLGLVYQWVRKRKSGKSFLFLLIAYIINVALCLIPFLYNVLVVGVDSDLVLGIAECLSFPLKAFTGEGRFEDLGEFSKVVPAFSWAYPFGIALAFLATVNTALQAFSNTLRNGLRLSFALKRKNCDIVVGTDINALRYAENGAAIVLQGGNLDKGEALSLIERGYIVWRCGFSDKLLKNRVFSRFCNYNIICPGGTEQNLDYINSFIAWRKAGGKKKIHLFVEIESSRTNTVRNEILDKSCCKESITTFCSGELLARHFTEEHPITEYMPRDFLEEDTSIKEGTALNVIYLGFGALNREMYRQSVMNNQLVIFKDGEYQLYPIKYHIFDSGIDTEDWCLNGLKKHMEEISEKKEEYYPLPPLPYETFVYDQSPLNRETLKKVGELISKPNSFFQIIVDVGDTYQNIETGSRLRALLGKASNYHVFIRSESVHLENDMHFTYLGDIHKIFNHETIVNDAMAQMAYTLNAIYAYKNMAANKENTPSSQNVRERADKSWRDMNYIKRYSNLYAALNLRLKLQLMGLDYVKEPAPEGQNKAMLAKYYPKTNEEKSYVNYFKRSLYTALLAQEKYRWNAYHLLQEIVPRPKIQVQAIEVIENSGKKTKMTTNDDPLINHACITTFAGLDTLSKDLAKKKSDFESKLYTAENFDFYQYDDLLLKATAELMDRLGYSLCQHSAYGCRN